MIIIFLFLFLVLPVSAMEIDVNYRWYKYKDSSYMSLEESKNIKGYIDYNDSIIDEYFDINDYQKIQGRYIYIYNNTEEQVNNIENINIYSNKKIIDYKEQSTNQKSISSKEFIILDLKSKQYLKDIEIEINYEGGELLVTFSDTKLNDTKLAYETINQSGKYKFYHLKNHQEIKYKTYYNRINGNYAKESYDDYIYKDLNDYKINYFLYKKTIDRNNMQILDIIDTNYIFLKYEGNIDFNKNGKYKIKLIFTECEKNIEIIVDIKDNKEIEKLKTEKIKLEDKIKKLKNNIKLKNKQIKKYENEILDYKEQIIDINKIKNELNINKKIYEKNKINYQKIVNQKNKCFNTLNDYKNIIDYLDNKYTNDKEYYERYIKKLEYVIDEKNHDFWNIKKSSIFVGFITNRQKSGKVK